MARGLAMRDMVRGLAALIIFLANLLIIFLLALVVPRSLYPYAPSWLR
jgi:hypothetical protein